MIEFSYLIVPNERIVYADRAVHTLYGRLFRRTNCTRTASVRREQPAPLKKKEKNVASVGFIFGCAVLRVALNIDRIERARAENKTRLTHDDDDDDAQVFPPSILFFPLFPFFFFSLWSCRSRPVFRRSRIAQFLFSNPRFSTTPRHSHRQFYFPVGRTSVNVHTQIRRVCNQRHVRPMLSIRTYFLFCTFFALCFDRCIPSNPTFRRPEVGLRFVTLNHGERNYYT